MRYDYDLASNLVTKSDTRLVNGAPPFVSISYQYDPLNRVIQRSYSDGTPQVTYVYDSATKGVGRLQSVSAGDVSTYNYSIYDAKGRPAAYSQVTAGQTYSMSSTYNKTGLVVNETYPSGKVMHTEYDSAGRPAGVTKNGAPFYYAGAPATDTGNRVQYSAHGAASVTKVGNGLWEHTNFNSRLQPTQIGLGVNQTSTSVLRLDYTYGLLVSGTLDVTKNNGNIERQTIVVSGASIKQSYVYDQVNRLIGASETVNSEKMPRWTQSYGYDRWGNRTSLVNSGSEGGLLPTQSTPTVDSATNRLVAHPYDNAGNMTHFNAGSHYDAENRLVFYQGIFEYSVAQFAYDGDGRRVKRYYPGPQGISCGVVYVYNPGGRLVAEYLDCSPFPGGPPPGLPNIKVSFLTADHLGSTRVATDQDQNLVARHDYMPFGEEIPDNVSGRATSIGYGVDDGIRQKFTSKERDSESGLDYFIARYYSSAHGRFTSPDEFTGGPDELFDFAEDASDNPTFYADLHEPQSLNKYQYCYNNPLIYVDPDGHKMALRVRKVGGTNATGMIATAGSMAQSPNPAASAIGVGILVVAVIADALINRGPAPAPPPATTSTAQEQAPSQTTTHPQPQAQPVPPPAPLEAHRSKRRKSTKGDHQKGTARKKTDQGREKADAGRERMPGPNWKGPGKREKEREKTKREEKEKKKQESK